MITIIDYGAGNLRSVANAIASLGYEARVTSRPEEVVDACAVILPGVGAAADTVSSLRRHGLDTALREVVKAGTPLFAVCVGLQVLFDETEEGGGCPCLGLLPGRVKLLPGDGLKVPHMGWNTVRRVGDYPLFEGIEDDSYFYFVHSYYAEPADPEVVVGRTEYGVDFASMVAVGNLVATQFHPEKSGPAGLRMYDNFIKTALRGT
ncbi:imidazole glycerol phosphate synthase, glutamine amidotransferase subunit [Dehalogenimonas lykanthroporepellens BL-DC-9]|nr:imidazole glycerol phosphate synthase, glutamine amidotransferase subunit [Dehalogenimonas lykanthroporepellens BL-DC-9]